MIILAFLFNLIGQRGSFVFARLFPMFRSILRMNIAKATAAPRAMSAATGMPYPAAMAQTLDKFPFASNLWLTEAQMKSVGLAVAAAQKDKGYITTGKIGFTLYNAEQTTDPAKVEALKGRMFATNALSGKKFEGSDIATGLSASAAKFPTNEWLSDKEVEGLALALKPNATPVSLTMKFTDKTALPDGKESVTEREVTRVFYNVADVAQPEAVAKAAKMYPVSASSGKAYSSNMALPMLRAAIANKYTSPYWITLSEAKAMGLLVKDASAGVEIAVWTSKETPKVMAMFFNAEQTTDPAKVEAFKGRMKPTHALTGEKIDGPLSASAAKFPTNEWVSDKEVVGLALALKPNATPVSLTIKFTDKMALPDGKESVTEREVTRVFYNVADVAQPEAVAKAAKMYPVSASSGQAYSSNMALPMLRAAIANKYTSPFWTTLGGAQAMGLLVKDASAGVEIAVSADKVMTFFNADQTNNAAKVAAHTYKAKFQQSDQRSAMSGNTFIGSAQTALSTAAMKNRHSSVYWLTRKQATFLGFEITAGQEPTEIAMNEGSIRVFNASQTNNKDAIGARFKKAF